jgi:catechol-2,3-dioxygenase
MQLGHVNIFVRDVERAEKFYAEILGLTVMNRMPNVSFLSANTALTHEIALVGLGKDAPGPEKGRVGLNHMAWQMATFDDLKEMVHRLQAHGVEMVRIGDHNNSLGVYFCDPDGNQFEVYYELPKDQWPEGKDGNIFAGHEPFRWRLDDETPSDSPSRTVTVV